MTTYTGAQKARPTFATADCGAWMDDNAVAVTSRLLTTDAVVLMDVPAGVRLQTLRYRSGDQDTDASPTLAVNIGYRTKLPGGSASNPTFFASASTALQAATTTWQEVVFAPIKFDEPVEIVIVPSAAATALSASATIHALATGVLTGIS